VVEKQTKDRFGLDLGCFPTTFLITELKHDWTHIEKCSLIKHVKDKKKSKNKPFSAMERVYRIKPWLFSE
jgi:hypothetical protein